MKNSKRLLTPAAYMKRMARPRQQSSLPGRVDGWRPPGGVEPEAIAARATGYVPGFEPPPSVLSGGAMMLESLLAGLDEVDLRERFAAAKLDIKTKLVTLMVEEAAASAAIAEAGPAVTTLLTGSEESSSMNVDTAMLSKLSEFMFYFKYVEALAAIMGLNQHYVSAMLNDWATVGNRSSDNGLVASAAASRRPQSASPMGSGSSPVTPRESRSEPSVAAVKQFIGIAQAMGLDKGGGGGSPFGSF